MSEGCRLHFDCGHWFDFPSYGLLPDDYGLCPYCLKELAPGELFQLVELGRAGIHEDSKPWTREETLDYLRNPPTEADFESEPLKPDGQTQIIDVDAMRGVVHVGFSCGHEAVLSVEPDKDHIVVHDGMCPVCNAKPVFKPITDLHHGRDVRGPKPLGGWPKVEIGVTNQSGRDIEKGDTVCLTACGILPCAHDWVDVGFHFSKFVCSKCDAVKP